MDTTTPYMIYIDDLPTELVPLTGLPVLPHRYFEHIAGRAVPPHATPMEFPAALAFGVAQIAIARSGHPAARYREN